MGKRVMVVAEKTGAGDPRFRPENIPGGGSKNSWE
jgi:hypothetical protein